MSFHDRDYETYVILGTPQEPPVWQQERWNFVAEVLAPYSTVPRGKAALRGHQLVPNSAKPGYFRYKGLGRLVWDKRSHDRWTSQVAPNSQTSPSPTLSFLEAWAPSWNVCEREGIAPDYYFCISPQSQRLGDKTIFDPLIIVACSVTLSEEYRNGIRQSILLLAANVKSQLTVTSTRPWGYEMGSGFVRAISALAHSGLFIQSNPHRDLVNPDMFKGSWQRIP